jgi:hypothetical protein
MRMLWCVTSLVLVVPLVLAQTIHPVAPGTKHHIIELTVSNHLGSVSIENVHVSVSKHSRHIVLSPTEHLIQNIPAGQYSAVRFMFDVVRSAPVNMNDTMEFRITHGILSWTKTIVVQYASPKAFSLMQNHPNPFNPTTIIEYQLPTVSRVSLKVFDVLGREVAALVDEVQQAGFMSVDFDATTFASGVYFYRLEAKAVDGSSAFRQVRKLMVTK